MAAPHASLGTSLRMSAASLRGAAGGSAAAAQPTSMENGTQPGTT